MQLTNTDKEYGLIARTFHWLIAFMILGLLPVGLFMGTLENSPVKFQIFALHKSFGLLVLFLGIARVIWRFVSPPPEHFPTHQRWERVLASAAHFWLYICIFGMPLSGWLMSSAGEFPIPFFGIQMPSLMGKNEKLGDLFFEIHAILGYTLLFILALHIAGALKHHVIDKDETLERMAFYKKGWLLPVLVILIAGASYAASAYLIGMDIFFSKKETVAPVAAVTGTAPAVPVDTSNLPKDGWAIDKAKSTLRFKASLYNAPFSGDFNDFSGTIIFNPNDLANAKADIRIGMKDVVTGDTERDTNIKGEDWFDTDKFPESRFQTIKFEKADGDNYVAIGNLTVRGVTMPLIIPFLLQIQGKTATMSAHVVLNRLDFKMGTGQWEDEKTVGHSVDVFIDLIAVQ